MILSKYNDIINMMDKINYSSRDKEKSEMNLKHEGWEPG
jgi:hypothetical protein